MAKQIKTAPYISGTIETVANELVRQAKSDDIAREYVHNGINLLIRPASNPRDIVAIYLLKVEARGKK